MNGDLYINRLEGEAEGKRVRIDIRQGSVIVCRVELSLEDFAAAVMGRGAIPVTITRKS